MLRGVVIYRRERCPPNRRKTNSNMSGIIDGASGLFYRVAASGVLPAAWFRNVDPAAVEKAQRTGRLSLEIVCHCYRKVTRF
jgi:hypothetical protein